MKKLRVSAIFLMIFMIFQLFGCAVNIPVPEEISSTDEANAIGLSIAGTTKNMKVGEYAQLGVKVKIDYNYALKWSSDNPEVATVDSNGRVDALSVGKATITAKVEKASVSCVVTVKEAPKETVKTSTAITSTKNQIILDQNKTNSIMNLYALCVNLETNCLTVYTYNEKGSYNIGVRSMVCSPAQDPSFYDTYVNDNPEDTAFYHINEKVGDANGWSDKEDGAYYRYRTTFSLNDKDKISFTSCAYSKKSPSSLIAEEYNKLGKSFTEGNVRLSVSDAKWIYDNCSPGTQIRFVSSGAKDVLGKPSTIKIAPECDVQNWDPTDADPKNPFMNKKPTFKGMEELTVNLGSIADLTTGVEVYDTGMNFMGNSYKVDGMIPQDKVGKYIVSYYYTDALGRRGRADRVVYVK